MATQESLNRSFERLREWCLVFHRDDDETARFNYETALTSRLEMDALVGLLQRKGLITEQEWRDSLHNEIEDHIDRVDSGKQVRPRDD